MLYKLWAMVGLFTPDVWQNAITMLFVAYDSNKKIVQNCEV